MATDGTAIQYIVLLDNANTASAYFYLAPATVGTNPKTGFPQIFVQAGGSSISKPYQAGAQPAVAVNFFSKAVVEMTCTIEGAITP